MNSDLTFRERFVQALADRLVRRALVIASLAGVVLLAAGIYYWQHNTAAGETLNAVYGRRTGGGSESVNGTAVLGRLFELHGYQVRTATRLSPRLRRDADVIVWFPNDYSRPTAEQREFFEQWLSAGRSRTLIYVGRDYDAAPRYWNAIRPLVSAEEAQRIAELESQAEKLISLRQSRGPGKEYARWYTATAGGTERQVKQLSGPWSQGVVAANTEIVVRRSLLPPQEQDATGKDDPAPTDENHPLLLGDGEVLAFRNRDFVWGDGEVIVVSNGSFLLNYPLVNPEHRKLAGNLIAECRGGRNVVFLESGPGGPEILQQEQAGGMAMLRIWPLNAIVIHLTVFGMVYCLARWPIFGRPKELPTENPADFGRHVQALGQLLERTKNQAYAESRLAHYQQQARRGSGAGHRK